jgi:4-hydroxy-tetrahydrodipicolinate reductase
VNYAIVGYGRMGRAVDEQASRRGHRRTRVFDPEAEVAEALQAIDAAALGEVDVAFEFSAPSAAPSNVLALLRAGTRVVCGTTGWQPSGEIERAAQEGESGAVIAPNFSVGMNLFYRLVRQAGRLYGAAGLHQPYLFESHHRGKRDAPSGTARLLASIIMDVDPRLTEVCEGNPPGLLPEGALHVSSVRAGNEPGTHTVGFDGEYDKITLTHSARGRAGFALGAVLAAEWIAERQGLHGFADVLESMVESTNQ